MRPIIGITMGDPAGIGPEIAVKSLAKKEIYEKCIPIVIGDFEALKEASEFTELNLELYGQASEAKNTSAPSISCSSPNLPAGI